MGEITFGVIGKKLIFRVQRLPRSSCFYGTCGNFKGFAKLVTDNYFYKNGENLPYYQMNRFSVAFSLVSCGTKSKDLEKKNWQKNQLGAHFYDVVYKKFVVDRKASKFKIVNYNENVTKENRNFI